LSAIASQPVRTADTPGTVRVYAVIRATVEEAWAALTQRELVGRWFGDLSESLQPGGAHRLDFGDGDSFEIFDVALDPPFRLFYREAFGGAAGVPNPVPGRKSPQLAAVVGRSHRVRQHRRHAGRRAADAVPHRSPGE